MEMTLNLESNSPWMWEIIFSNPDLDSETIEDIFNDSKFFGEQLNISMASHLNTPICIVMKLYFLYESDSNLRVNVVDNLKSRLNELSAYLQKKKKQIDLLADQVELFEENMKLKKAYDLFKRLNNE